MSGGIPRKLRTSDKSGPEPSTTSDDWVPKVGERVLVEAEVVEIDTDGDFYVRPTDCDVCETEMQRGIVSSWQCVTKLGGFFAHQLKPAPKEDES